MLWRYGTVFLGLALLCGAIPGGFADDAEAERLIDQLVDVAEPGFGYSVTTSGDEFLPYQGSGKVGTMILGGVRPKPSDNLRKIVEMGGDAVPALLRHLGDSRPCKLQPVSGFMWMDFSDEYDFNRRTSDKPPEGVNSSDRGFAENRPDKHVVTVGDLCFVALGQIVNRSFEAVRYQPSGGAVVNSPTYSAALRRAALAEWGGLTKEQHRQRLVNDFTKADHEDRRIGAYLRLAFYYPDEVESIVLNELAQPTYDAFAVHHLCREVLYKTEDKSDRRRIFDEFVRKNGDVATAGVMDHLFGDLETLEANEQGRIRPPVDWLAKQPRELLVELFGRPPTVKAEDRPLIGPIEASQRARLIGELTHDRSPKITDAVRGIFVENAENGYFAKACLGCLAKRGQAGFLIEQLGRIDISNRTTNTLYVNYIEGIATSHDQPVLEKLWEIIQATMNPDYLVAALGVIEGNQKLPELVNKLITFSPEDSKQARTLLILIGYRFPNDAEAIYRSFLANGSTQRVETACKALWGGKPLSKTILAPYLNDKREVPGSAISSRVCDLAAEVISQTTDQIQFDVTASIAERNAQIERLKEYCRER